MSRFSTNLSPAISHLAQELRVWPWQGKYVEQNRSALVEQTLVFLRHITEEQQSFDINLGPLSPDQCLGLPFPTNPRKAAILIRFCSWPLQAPPSGCLGPSPLAHSHAISVSGHATSSTPAGPHCTPLSFPQIGILQLSPPMPVLQGCIPWTSESARPPGRCSKGHSNYLDWQT